MENPTREQYELYQQIYDLLNKKLFNNELNNCLLNFSRKKSSVGGYFAPTRWQKNDKNVHEIALNPGGWAFENLETFVGVLLHEMCHLWQQDYGTPSRTTYHNKEWACKMEDVGLVPSDTGKEGGKKTGQHMVHYIPETSPLHAILDEIKNKKLWVPVFSEATKKAPKNKNKIKYTCPSCGVNAWGKPMLNIVCGECDLSLETKE